MPRSLEHSDRGTTQQLGTDSRWEAKDPPCCQGWTGVCKDDALEIHELHWIQPRQLPLRGKQDSSTPMPYVMGPCMRPRYGGDACAFTRSHSDPKLLSACP